MPKNHFNPKSGERTVAEIRVYITDTGDELGDELGQVAVGAEVLKSDALPPAILASALEQLAASVTEKARADHD